MSNVVCNDIQCDKWQKLIKREKISPTFEFHPNNFVPLFWIASYMIFLVPSDI